MRLSVELTSETRSPDAPHSAPGLVRPAAVVDLSLAGAGLELDEALVVGERVSITLATPLTWDPIVIDAIVAWCLPARSANETDLFGRARAVARAGVAFEHPDPRSVLAVFEVLASVGYE